MISPVSLRPTETPLGPDLVLVSVLVPLALASVLAAPRTRTLVLSIPP